MFEKMFKLLEFIVKIGSFIAKFFLVIIVPISLIWLNNIYSNDFDDFSIGFLKIIVLVFYFCTLFFIILTKQDIMEKLEQIRKEQIKNKYENLDE